MSNRRRSLRLFHVLMASLLVTACAASGTAASSASPTVAAVATVTRAASPTVASTPPRTSRASWASQAVSVSDVVERFRSAGLSVKPRAPSNVVIFGAERLDLFLIQGETTAIYTFATAAASARVLDDAANARLTVSYLRTPYYIQIANLLVVITTDDPKAAAASILALTRS